MARPPRLTRAEFEKLVEKTEAAAEVGSPEATLAIWGLRSNHRTGYIPRWKDQRASPG